MCVMIWCYCDDMCAMVCDGMVLCTGYLYMCYLCFEMQGFKRKQIKTKPTGTFAVCRHTAKRTKSPLLCADTRQRGHMSAICRLERRFLDQVVGKL
jgi:hypothetical protein